jgi:cytochrome c-type biogenesis protein CcmH/NrfF
MKTWAVVLLLWLAPAVVLLVALVRANFRKSARRRAEDNAQRKQAPAE